MSRTKAKQIFIHIGSPKTGTTSIQNTLYNFCLENAADSDFHYINFSGKPTSNIFTWIFGSHFSDKLKLIEPDLSESDVASHKENFLSAFEEQITKNSSKKLVLSAEGFSNLDPEEFANFHSYVSTLAEEVTYVGYLRPYYDYYSSMYQQHLKQPFWRTSANSIDVSGKRVARSLFKFYENFYAFSKIVGEKNFLVTEFEKARLHNNNVVADFTQKAGLNLGDYPERRANESLCQHGASALFLLNKYKPEVKHEKKQLYRGYMSLVHKLTALQAGPKLKFSNQLNSTLLGHYPETVDYMLLLGLQFQGPKLHTDEPRLRTIESLDKLPNSIRKFLEKNLEEKISPEVSKEEAAQKIYDLCWMYAQQKKNQNDIILEL